MMHYKNLLYISAVLYICTEDKFPSKRLLQLMNNIQHPFKNLREIPYGDRIFVEHIADVVRIYIIFLVGAIQYCHIVSMFSERIERVPHF